MQVIMTYYSFVSDAKYNVVCDALAALRNHLGKELKLFNPDEFAFLWVVDFPMFEYDDELNVIMRLSSIYST